MNKAARIVTPDRIQEQLRKDIIIGKYRKGDRIVETELAEAFGASRGSVRSALQALETEGMIEVLSNGRKEVVGFTRKEVRDMYDLRWMIEDRAAQIVRERKSLLSPLLSVLSRIETCAQQMSPDTDWYELDLEYHRALVQASGSAPLLKAWEITMPTMYALLELNTSIDYRERYVEEFLGKHRRLFELLITSSEEIHPLLREHIMDACAISEHVMEHFNP